MVTGSVELIRSIAGFDSILAAAIHLSADLASNKEHRDDVQCET